jgi:hypothetical protein
MSPLLGYQIANRHNSTCETLLQTVHPGAKNVAPLSGMKIGGSFAYLSNSKNTDRSAYGYVRNQAQQPRHLFATSITSLYALGRRLFHVASWKIIPRVCRCPLSKRLTPCLKLTR